MISKRTFQKSEKSTGHLRYSPASSAKAGIVKTDAMLTRATEVQKETVNKFPYGRYPSMLFLLREKK